MKRAARDGPVAHFRKDAAAREDEQVAGERKGFQLLQRLQALHLRPMGGEVKAERLQPRAACERTRVFARRTAEAERAQAGQLRKECAVRHLAARGHLFDPGKERQHGKIADRPRRRDAVAKISLRLVWKHLGRPAQTHLRIGRLIGGIQLALAVSLALFLPFGGPAGLVFPMPAVHGEFDQEFGGVALLNRAPIVERPADECFGLHVAALLAKNGGAWKQSGRMNANRSSSDIVWVQPLGDPSVCSMPRTFRVFRMFRSLHCPFLSF